MGKTLSIWFAFSLIVGCAALIPPKVVTLVENGGHQFIGKLTYDGPFSGELVVENGPNNERFSGRFTVIDRTSTQKTQGTIVVPQNNQLPGVGSVASTSSGQIQADGYWFASGSRGTNMQCELKIGIGGHGYGVCKHSNGAEYKILL